MEADATTTGGQTVVFGNVRITVLTERLVRIEHAEDGSFEDRPTLTVANRRFVPVAFTAEASDGVLVVDTGAVRVTCSDPSGPLTAGTLEVTTSDGDGAPVWRYGDLPPGNLGGTVRTLDMWRGNCTQRVTGFDPETGFIREWDPQPLGDGLLSRDGWAVLDDSGSVVLEATAGSAGVPWPTARPPSHTMDVYLFGHGADHRGALADGNALIGPQSLPPRYAFGYWYSRYYPYTDTELLELVANFERYGMPIDVLVIDMDWHRVGWTGYSWDHDLIADPTATLRQIHDHGLRVALNLHPADGVAPHEDAYPQMCESLGIDPSSQRTIPFDPTDPAFVDAYFRILHHPEEDRGVDFWWLDWQQGTESTMAGLDPLAWLNQIHWDDQIARRPSRRPINFSRWDGPGAARRPIGFSGDTFATWESLAFQPYFTATAANVLFGYWSHDIGGHLDGSADAELYTRWVQFGVHSPILRTHGTVGLVEERRIWEYPNPYRDIMIGSIRRRYELIPYIYAACRRGVDDGTSLVRPMYHDHPDEPSSYECDSQYMFGSDMIVTPVVEPAGTDGLAGATTWLPRGSWYDCSRGRMLRAGQGGMTVDARYLLDEVPVFVRAGAVVPTQQGVMRLDEPYFANLCLDLYPGGDGDFEIYEDDGTTTGYASGESVSIRARHSQDDDHRCIELSGAVGSYAQWTPQRPVTVRFIGEVPSGRVLVDGSAVPWSAHGAAGTWSYDATRGAVVVAVGSVDLRSGLRVEFVRDGGPTKGDRALLEGLPGLLHRMSWIDGDVRVLLNDASRTIARIARTGRRIAADPGSWLEQIRSMTVDLATLPAAIDAARTHWAQGEMLDPSSPPRASIALDRARAQLDAARADYPSAHYG